MQSIYCNSLGFFLQSILHCDCTVDTCIAVPMKIEGYFEIRSFSLSLFLFLLFLLLVKSALALWIHIRRSIFHYFDRHLSQLRMNRIFSWNEMKRNKNVNGKMSRFSKYINICIVWTMIMFSFRLFRVCPTDQIDWSPRRCFDSFEKCFTAPIPVPFPTLSVFALIFYRNEFAHVVHVCAFV